VELWKFTAGNPILSGPVIDADGTLYFGTENSKLYAVGADGKQRWTYQILGGNGPPSYPLITSKGQVVFGAGGGFVQGLRVADGKEAWLFDLDGAPYSAGREPVRGAPALAPNYGNILIGADNANVYELGEGGGYVSVRRGEAGPVRAGTAVTTDGTVIWASGDPGLFGGLAQGGNKWSVFTDGQLSTPVVGPDNTVYAFSEGGSLFAVTTDGKPRYGYDDSQVKDPLKDAEKRKPIWSQRVGGRFRGSPVMGADGTLYAGADDGKLYAVDPINGKARWSFSTGAAITGAPAIGANGLIYVGSVDSRLYVISPDGKEMASIQLDGAIDRSSPAIGKDGTLYVGTRLGTLYAFKEGRPDAVPTAPATPVPQPTPSPQPTLPLQGTAARLATTSPQPTQPTATPQPTSPPQPTTTPTPAAPAAPPPPVVAGGLPTERVDAAGEGRYFAETGHNVKGPFLDFFDSTGGVDYFGYPRTEEIVLDGRRVQYFQRARMELFPEQAGTPFAVQLTLLGDILTADRRPFPQGQPSVPQGQPSDNTAEARYFPEVSHTLRGPFLRYFDANDGLIRLGYPISEELQEPNEDGSGRSYTVQYFQRARMEHHPEQAGTPYEVQLGLLGDQDLRRRGWLP
jgi:outer membrane protein assembly factor BamB